MKKDQRHQFKVVTFYIMLFQPVGQKELEELMEKSSVLKKENLKKIQEVCWVSPYVTVNGNYMMQDHKGDFKDAEYLVHDILEMLVILNYVLKECKGRTIDALINLHHDDEKILRAYERLNILKRLNLQRVDEGKKVGYIKAIRGFLEKSLKRSK